MILPIYVYGSAVLREPAKAIEPDYPELKTLISNMFETMTNAEGVGLAAPQIGLAIRLFIIDASPMAEDEPSCLDFRKVFINPEIIEFSGDSYKYREGCLSLPDLREDVSRQSVIKIRYWDEDFVEHTETYDGFRARAIQHEYDHIEGVLLIDHLSPLKVKMLKKKLDMMSSGKKTAHYKTKIN